jgi:alkaline phosphatase D
MTEPRFDRRRFVRGAAIGAGAIAGLDATGTPFALARRVARDGEFRQGVASGEPGPHGMTLWTRVEGIDRRQAVGLEVARDAHFRRVVHRVRPVVEPSRDNTVHVRVAGKDVLAPGEEYFYRFHTQNSHSPVGRFRTAFPAGSREPLRIAFFSCQEFIAGFYHAHADLARQDVDLVVCLGDYVYEQAFADNTSVSQPVREDKSAPDGETQTLEEYRAKYALYHTDPNLIEVRRQFPLVGEWDDHEVEDNYAGTHQGGAATNRRIPFLERRANGYRAWLEQMPRMRLDPARIYRKLDLGNAELFLLDTRQFRDDQPCNPSDSFLSQPCPPTTTDDPARTLMGAKQKAWLKSELRRSRARWKLIANQVMIASLDAPPHSPLNTDSWDGYGAERAELIDFIADEGIEDVAFVTGDIHTFFAAEVTRTGRRAVRGDVPDPVNGPPRAVEFVGGAVTSPGTVDRVASSEPQRVAAAAPVDAGVLGNNPHMEFSNQAYKGYAIVTANRDDLRVRYRAVRDTRMAQSEVFTLRRFTVERGRSFIASQDGPLPQPAPSPPGPLPPGQAPLPISAGSPLPLPPLPGL